MVSRNTVEEASPELTEKPKEIKVSHEDVQEAKAELAGRPLDEVARMYAQKGAQLEEVELKLKELREKYERLEEVAGRDGLTGLFNRDGFILAFENTKNILIREARETGAAQAGFNGYTLIWADMVGLKALNDKFGVKKGDEKLIETSNVLTASARRSTDVVGRYGGDDFIVGLLNTNMEEAMQVVHTIQEVKPTDLTLSIGIAEFSPDVAVKDAMYKAADAMEVAKQMGKKDENTRSLGIGVFTIDTRSVTTGGRQNG